MPESNIPSGKRPDGLRYKRKNRRITLRRLNGRRNKFYNIEAKALRISPEGEKEVSISNYALTENSAVDVAAGLLTLGAVQNMPSVFLRLTWDIVDWTYVTKEERESKKKLGRAFGSLPYERNVWNLEQRTGVFTQDSQWMADEFIESFVGALKPFSWRIFARAWVIRTNSLMTWSTSEAKQRYLNQENREILNQFGISFNKARKDKHWARALALHMVLKHDLKLPQIYMEPTYLNATLEQNHDN